MKPVLVVDNVEDRPSGIPIYGKILKKRGGLEVKYTEDVEEILQLAQSGTIGLILMDVSLSNIAYQGKPIDGLKITKMLKENPQTAHIPVVLMTANAMSGDRENFLKQSDADDYITKPITDHQKFVDQIKALMLKD